jgi:thioesterase domain-containing protein
VQLAAILSAPTVAELASELDRSVANPQAPLVWLGSGHETVVPLVALPLQTGSVYTYRALAQALDHVAIAGLEDPALTGSDASSPMPVTAWIEHLADLIQQGLAGFPESLIGYSSAGQVAIAVAQAFSSRGCPVKRVFLIDSFAVEPGRAMRERDINDLIMEWAHFAIARTAGAVLDLPQADLNALGTLEAKIERAVSAFHEAIEGAADVDLPTWVRRFRAYHTNFERYRDLVLTPYAGPVVLLRAARREAGLAADPAQSWNGLLPALDIRDIDADHQSIVEAPAVDVVARAIEEYLLEQ